MGVGHRSYAPSCIVCLLLTFLVPIWAQVIKYGYVDANSPELLSTVVAIIVTLGSFYILGLLLVAILRLDLSIKSTLNVLTYALTPLNLGLWLVYGFNYAYAKRLTVVSFVLTGAGNIHDLFFGQLPLASFIIFIWVLLVAFYCVQNGTEQENSSALAFVLLLAPSAVVSLGIGAFVGDMVRPGFLQVMLHLFGLLP